MVGIHVGIEVDDQLGGILSHIIASVNIAVSAMNDMRESISASIDTSVIEGVRNEISQITAEIIVMNETLNNPPAPEIEPSISWKTDSMEVFNGTGIERFRQEVQSADAMLQRLCGTQDAIARRAFDANIFPPEAFQNLNAMAVRVDNIRDRIQQIESNPRNMGTDTANAELERLRSQLSTMAQEQDKLNKAVQDMDVSAANEAYLKLNQTVMTTERYLRDEVNEQGRFNQEVKKGVNVAERLQSMISSVVKKYVGKEGIEKSIEWIKDCTKEFNAQRSAELQLVTVLANTQGPGSVSQIPMETEITVDTSEAIAEINDLQNTANNVTVAVSADTQPINKAFDAITAKASEIQSRGIYSDEAMIAGAAEFSTHFTDTKAIEMMMDTLADYAMGMSGGGEQSSAAITNYAASLGKAMSGSYDALTEKGLKFTEAQKAIIEGTATQEQIIATIGEEYLNASRDVQAAAAINSGIAASWGGLYESMSNTPEGKIIQMNNAWSSMKGVIGGQLYPFVILFVDAITSHWGTIQAVLDGITLGLQFMMGLLSGLLNGAMNFGQMIIDNWSWISPLIYGIVAALAVYGTYLAITNGIELAAAAAQGALTLVKMLAVPVYAALTGTTMAEAAAQMELNSAMYACPIVWIIILIIALIALLVAVCSWIANVTDVANSGLGIIVGALKVAGAFIHNLFAAVFNMIIDIIVVIWNRTAAFANFLGNVFTDPLGAIARLIFDLVDCALGLLQTLASAIDTLFGSKLAGAVQGWRDDLGGWVDETFGKGKEFTAKISGEDLHINRSEYGEAWEAGVQLGDSIAEAIDNFSLSDLFGVKDIPDPEDYLSGLGQEMEDSGISEDLNSIVENTGAAKDSLDITQEELKYLRDIAEQEAVNRFTTAEIKIDMTGMRNTINNGDDIDGFITKLTDSVNEAVYSMTEGVHA